MLKYLLSLLVVGCIVSVSARYSSGYRSSYSSYRSYSSYSSYRSYNSYRAARYNTYRAAQGYYSYYSGLYLYYPYSGAYGTYYRTNGRYNDGASGNICKNYQTNVNGTSLGEFKCPMPWEPSSHTYCCGSSQEEYCCQFKDSSLIYLAVFGAIAGVVIIAIIVSCGIKAYKKKDVNVAPSKGSYPVSNQPVPYSFSNNGQNGNNPAQRGRRQPNSYGPQNSFQHPQPGTTRGNSSWQHQNAPAGWQQQNSPAGWQQPPAYSSGYGEPATQPYHYAQQPSQSVYNQPPESSLYSSPPEGSTQKKPERTENIEPPEAY